MRVVSLTHKLICVQGTVGEGKGEDHDARRWRRQRHIGDMQTHTDIVAHAAKRF